MFSKPSCAFECVAVDGWEIPYEDSCVERSIATYYELVENDDLTSVELVREAVKKFASGDSPLFLSVSDQKYYYGVCLYSDEEASEDFYSKKVNLKDKKIEMSTLKKSLKRLRGKIPEIIIISC